MNKYYTLKLPLLLLVAILTACHKYPEDEFITYVKPGKRIIGYYNMTHYYVNNSDSISSPRYFCMTYGKAFVAQTIYQGDSLQFGFGIDNSNIGGWSYVVNFQDNDKCLHFRNRPDSTYNYGVNPFIVNEGTWRILKLTDSQLILSSTIGKNFYELHFEK